MHRPDVAVGIDGTAGLEGVSVWIGEVVGARAGLSAVVFTVHEATNTVWGSIRYLDRRAQRIRSFKASATWVACLL